MAANPVRPVALLKDIRDMFVDLAGEDDPDDEVVAEFFKKLLLIDTVVGDTLARDRFTAELEKEQAKDDPDEDRIRVMEQVLGG